MNTQNNPLLSQGSSSISGAGTLTKKESLYDINPIVSSNIRPSSNQPKANNSTPAATPKKSQPLGASMGALDNAYSPPKANFSRPKKPPPPVGLPGHCWFVLMYVLIQFILCLFIRKYIAYICFFVGDQPSSFSTPKLPPPSTTGGGGRKPPSTAPLAPPGTQLLMIFKR